MFECAQAVFRGRAANARQDQGSVCLKRLAAEPHAARPVLDPQFELQRVGKAQLVGWSNAAQALARVVVRVPCKDDQLHLQSIAGRGAILPARMPAYEVRLDQFTGPLDLLLHLVRTSEMDIFALDLALLTDQYLAVIEAEGVRDLAGAYHFLAMAATLVEMKSRLLLPRQTKESDAAGLSETESDEEAWLDPAEQLSRQLVAYQGIQAVTAELSRRFDEVGRHWPRALVEQLESEIVYTLESLSIYDLMSAFEEVLARPRFKQITIFREDYDLEEARSWLRGRLESGPALLEDLLSTQRDALALITTFIGLLEMIKEDELEFSRDETSGGIWLTLATRDSLV